MINFKLYELNAMLEDTLNNIYAIAEDNDGELPDDWGKRLDSIVLDRKMKILDIAKYIKALNYKTELIKKELDQLNKRYKNYSSNANSLKSYLLYNINNGEIFEDATTKITWRKSIKVIIDDENKLPDHYFKIIKTPNLSSIKQDLKLGAICTGAHLEYNNNLQIK